MKPVFGFEGFYEIDDVGNLFSIDRIEELPQKGIICTRMRKGRKMIVQIGEKGYGYYTLSKKGKVKRILAHKLVIESFLGQRPDGMTINHIDGNKLNNHISNLEYCTMSENQKHAFRIGLSKPCHVWKGKFYNEHHSSKQVNQINKEGKIIKQRDCIKRAADELGLGKGCISACCRGEQKTAYGYIRKFETGI